MKEPFRYDSPNEIRQLLEEHHLAMNKKFGQNFLLSSHARARIADHVTSGEGPACWEIGPGIGALTAAVLPKASEVTAFEIDHGFISILKDLFSEAEHFHLVEGDALRRWPEYLSEHGLPDVIFGNLPYNVGAACIASFIEKGCLPRRMVFTLQKEVVQRICASEGSKTYSSFSVLCAMDYHSELLFDIPAGAFYPAPEVVSSVVLMRKKEKPLIEADHREGFIAMVQQLFSQRRKTILNNLSRMPQCSGVGKQALSETLLAHGFDPKLRAEVLSPERMRELYFAVTQPERE